MKKQTGEAEQLRSEIGGRARKRGPLPQSIRERGKVFVHNRARAGASVEAISAELGLATRTIERWLAADAPDAPAAMVPVRIIPDPHRPSTPSADAVVVTTARGLRIVGLDLDGLCALVARCG